MPADYNHLILYAKHWYKRSDLMTDLKIILGERCAIEPEHMTENTVWELCVDALSKYLPASRFSRFVLGLFTSRWDEGSPFMTFTNNCPLERAIKNILGELAALKVRNSDKEILLDLGEPDSSILPLQESTQ